MYYFYFMCDIFYIIAHLIPGSCSDGGCPSAADGCSFGGPSSDGSGSLADDDTSDPNSFGSAGQLTDLHSVTISDIFVLTIISLAS